MLQIGFSMKTCFFAFITFFAKSKWERVGVTIIMISLRLLEYQFDQMKHNLNFLRDFLCVFIFIIETYKIKKKNFQQSSDVFFQDNQLQPPNF